MGADGGRGWRRAALGLTFLLVSPPVPARGAITNDPPSAVSLPAGIPPTEAADIRKLLETYVHAVEGKDVQMFRTVKPNLSEEEERRVRAAFKSIQTQVVKMNVLSVDVKETKATVKVSRRDTINGTIVSSFPQTFQLAREQAGWTIQDIGR
jgi:hypothetical protein